MFRWIPYAFVRITLFFCVGILAGMCYRDNFKWLYALLLLSVLFLVYVLALKTGKRARTLHGILAMLITSVAGFTSVLVRDHTLKPDHLIHVTDTIEYYQGRVDGLVVEKERSWKAQLSLEKIKTRDGWRPISGDVLVYVPKADSTSVVYGDRLLVRGSPHRVPAPANPDEFDYRRFLSYRNIYHQHFLREGGCHKLGNSPSSLFISYAYKTRLWADSSLKRHVDGTREQALASALVLGVTDGLDQELMSAYSATGAMHVLSVSGLHVGIVYWLILLAFQPFARFKQSRWILVIVSLVVLWMYAFVTGISPSVLRAVTMFSFAAVARAFNYPTNIYNILAASAFFLLLVDPFMIASVGFQLSYLAVLGIVSMQPGLYGMWEPQNRLLDEIWKVAAVSIAAQAATLFISFYYFHQFPNYFLLTNLFVIPASFAVLMGGIGILAFSFFGAVAQLLGTCLHWIIYLVNSMVFFLEDLPFSVIDGIQINVLQCILGILMVIVLIYWFETKRYASVYVLASLCVVFSLSGWVSYFSEMSDMRFMVYAIRGESAFEIITDGKVLAMGEPLKNPSSEKFHVEPNRLRRGATVKVPVDEVMHEYQGARLAVFRGYSFLHVTDRSFFIEPHEVPDFLILSENSIRSVRDLPEQFASATIILDGTYAPAVASRFLSESKEHGWRVFSVMHDGAFQITLSNS